MCESLDELFVAAVDAVEPHVIGVIHEVVLEAVVGSCLVRFRGEVAVDECGDELAEGRCADGLDPGVEACRRRVWTSAFCSPFRIIRLIEFPRCHVCGGVSVEALPCGRRGRSKVLLDVGECFEPCLVVEDGGAGHGCDGQSELGDELPEGIDAGV